MITDLNNEQKRYRVFGHDTFVSSGPPEEWENSEYTIGTFDTLEKAVARAERASRDTNPLTSPSLRDTIMVRDEQTSTVLWRS